MFDGEKSFHGAVDERDTHIAAPAKGITTFDPSHRPSFATTPRPSEVHTTVARTVPSSAKRASA